MLLERSAGILLHPTSLPNNEGIGTLGKSAYQFIDWLHSAKIGLWQVLPLGPTGYGDSPYASFSSFAGNPLLIDLDMLVEQGLLEKEDIQLPEWLSSDGDIDFGSVVYWKIPLLKKAARCFLDKKEAPYIHYTNFCSGKKHLHEYALFMSIKEVYDKKAAEASLFGKLWNNYWPKELALHQADALAAWETAHADAIEIQKVIQFFFFEQWRKLKTYAHQKNILIIGDIPIFVAPDSSDVWANQSLFQLTKDGVPTVVAGVPPDYFSATGQLWGNPLYNWDKMKEEKYRWWLDRIDACLELVDYIRIDHFRGFESYWAVPFGAETAIDGQWLPGPDHDFFEAVQRALLKKDPRYAAALPIIAEDLGVITPQVERLRDDFHLPGMKILQFAFSAADVNESGFTNAFLPHTYTKSSVVYTGTHDNTTLRAWIDTLSREDFSVMLSYLTGEQTADEVLDELFAENQENAAAMKDELCGLLIKAAFMSVSVFAVIPFQDLYALGKEARINEPSTLGKNWVWRMKSELLTAECAGWLAHLVTVSGRTVSDHTLRPSTETEGNGAVQKP